MIKLMNNSVFGEHPETRRHNAVHRFYAPTISRRISLNTLMLNIEVRTIYKENLAAIHMAKTELKFNKPI